MGHLHTPFVDKASPLSYERIRTFPTHAFRSRGRRHTSSGSNFRRAGDAAYAQRGDGTIRREIHPYGRRTEKWLVECSAFSVRGGRTRRDGRPVLFPSSWYTDVPAAPRHTNDDTPRSAIRHALRSAGAPIIAAADDVPAPTTTFPLLLTNAGEPSARTSCAGGDQSNNDTRRKWGYR